MKIKKYFHNKKEAQTILKEESERGIFGSYRCMTHAEEYIFDAVVREPSGIHHRIDYFFKAFPTDDSFHLGEQVWVQK